MPILFFMIISFLFFHSVALHGMDQSNKNRAGLSFKDRRVIELEKKIEGISFLALVGINKLPKSSFSKEQKYFVRVMLEKEDKENLKLFQAELKEKMAQRDSNYAGLSLEDRNNNEIKEKIEGVSFLASAGIKNSSKAYFTKEQKYFINCKFAELNRCWFNELPMELQEKVIEGLIPSKVTPDGLLFLLKDLAHFGATNKQARDLMCAELKKYFYKWPEYGLNAQHHCMRNIIKRVFLSVDSDVAIVGALEFIKKYKGLKNSLLILFKTNFKSVDTLIRKYKIALEQKKLHQEYDNHASADYEKNIKEKNKEIKKNLEVLLRIVNPNILIDDKTFLEKALEDNDLEMLDFLLDKGADINFLHEVTERLVFVGLSQEDYWEMFVKANLPSFMLSRYEQTLLNAAVHSNPQFALELLKRDNINPTLGRYEVDLDTFRKDYGIYKELFEKLMEKGLDPQTTCKMPGYFNGIHTLKALYNEACVGVDAENYLAKN